MSVTTSAADTINPGTFRKLFETQVGLTTDAADCYSALIASQMPRESLSNLAQDPESLKGRISRLQVKEFPLTAQQRAEMGNLVVERLLYLMEGGTPPAGRGGPLFNFVFLSNTRAGLAKWLAVPESNLGRQVDTLEKALGLAVTAMAVSVVFAGVVTGFNPSTLALWNTAIYQLGVVIPVGMLVVASCAYLAYQKLESEAVEALLKKEGPGLQEMLDRLTESRTQLEQEMPDVGETPTAKEQLERDQHTVKMREVDVKIEHLRQKLKEIAPVLLGETPDDLDNFFEGV